MITEYGYNIFLCDDKQDFLINGEHKIKYNLTEVQNLTWSKALSLYEDPKEILQDKKGNQYLNFVTKKQKKNYYTVLVKFFVIRENIYDCRSFRIDEITPWTDEIEEKLLKEVKIEQEQKAVEYKAHLNNQILTNPDRYSDHSFIFTEYDLAPITSLEDLKTSVKKAYEGMTWNGYYDGSRGEAMDDGENKERIEILYHLGRKLGMKLVALPDFDSDDRMEWNGKDGLIEDPDEED